MGTQIPRKRKAIEYINPPANQINEMFNNIQKEVVGEEAPVFLKLQRSIKIVNPKNYYTLNHIELTTRFLDYQKQCVRVADTSGFILETHQHEILSLSSVLLLKPNQHSTSLLEHFSNSEANMLRGKILNSDEVEFSMEVNTQIMMIVKNLIKKRSIEITRFQRSCS